MESKKVLFTGIILLIIGIFVRKFTSYESTGLFLILIGVIFKTIYIIAKAKSGAYKPGRELLFLGVGLLLFLFGLFLRRSDPEVTYPFILIVSGLILKVIFIILFIRKVKEKTKFIDGSTMSGS